uniref:RRM domain-containing protein n=1 Tax=Trichobilharzia regenti TaxID=157069 RepID=A0AA85JRM0_TRIRE|nr:unnamed protein product [Trichobilharzia regenti]CAH8826052.1 unnamed protein product [Trichobilharzia regenti]CAH8826055.1 unnamed protein product [Trichobilharzia regenti]
MSYPTFNVGRKRSRPEDWSEAGPSPVIHIRGLPRNSVEYDIVKSFESYGRIRDVTMIPQKNQALVEFEDQASAEGLINTKSEMRVLNSLVQVAFSTSKHIVQRAANRAPPDEKNSLSSDNHILLFTIFNAERPVTVETIHRITSCHGRVLRIVIFRKSQVQAMVEFASVQEARNAKLHLNGADIYPGCCTLKVDYARPTRLSISRNDQDNWDFEICASQANYFQQDPQYQNSLLGFSDVPYNSYDGYGQPSFENQNDYMQPYISPYREPSILSHNMSYAAEDNRNRNLNCTRVVMLYNIDTQKMNCDRVFNLLCLYGNVNRVKFLRSKEGSAMVEMADTDAALCVIRNFSGVSFMGNQLMVRTSKQDVILDVSSPFQLLDGSPSFKDYSKDRNNRYTTPTMAKKNRIHPPSRTLHYWNAPPKITVDDILEFLQKCGAAKPQHVEQFSKVPDKPSSGTIKWATDAEACEALAYCNHLALKDDESTHPYTIKLSFANPNLSSEPIHVGSHSNGSENGGDHIDSS